MITENITEEMIRELEQKIIELETELQALKDINNTSLLNTVDNFIEQV
jgi:phage shock protein A